MNIISLFRKWFNRNKKEQPEIIKIEQQRISREKIVDVARSWIGTPYRHQARVKYKGVDCAMLVAGIALESGIIDKFDYNPIYTQDWHNHRNEEMLLATLDYFGCEEIDLEQAKPGDIVAFKFGRACAHMGVLVEQDKIVHATFRAGKVVEVYLQGELKRTMSKAYRMPGVY